MRTSLASWTALVMPAVLSLKHALCWWICCIFMHSSLDLFHALLLGGLTSQLTHGRCTSGPISPFHQSFNSLLVPPLFSVTNLPLWQNCSCSIWGYTYFSFNALNIRKSEIPAQTPEPLLYSSPNFSVMCPLNRYCQQVGRDILSEKMGSALSQTSKAWYWLFNYETQLDFFREKKKKKSEAFSLWRSSVILRVFQQ